MKKAGGTCNGPRLDETPGAPGTEGDGDFAEASWTEEHRPESAQQPVARRQVRRPLASTAQDDELLLEQEILRHHRSHTTGATELRGHDGQVQQGEQEVPHVRVSVGQTSGAAQRCRILTNRALFGRSSRHCASLRQTSRGRVKHSQRLALIGNGPKPGRHKATQPHGDAGYGQPA